MTKRNAVAATCGLLVGLLSLTIFAKAQQGVPGSVSGVVKDRDGAVVAGARVLLIQTQQAVLRSTHSGADGHFRFEGVLSGTYEIRVGRADFSNRRVPVQVLAGDSPDITITLELAQLSDDVTVTAEAGQVQDKNRVAQQVNVISEEAVW